MTTFDDVLFKAQNTRWTFGKVATMLLLFVFVIIILANIGNIAQRNSSGIYMVQQSYLTGAISVKTTPGFFFKKFALTTPYKAASSYKYSDKDADKKTATGPPIQARFNDGGKAKVYGDVRFVLPQNSIDMKHIHEIFGGQKELMKECFSQITKEAVVMTAALMSSEESYATKRAIFADMVRDQIANGIYLIEGKYQLVSGTTDQREWVIDIKTDDDNNYVRKETVVSTFGIRVAQCVINDIVYLDGLDEMIGKKRDFLTNIIAAKSAAEKAEQEMETAEATGKKNVEISRYAALESAEKIVSRVTNEMKMFLIAANKELSVARDGYYAALDEKQSWILKGQGEAEKRRLEMLADGAIKTKQIYYGNAVKAYSVALSKRRLVPKITTQQANTSKDGLPPGIAILNQIENQLQRELGVDLTFKGVR
ncbi:hypothetical protein ACFL1Y_00010 [Patescibacteria group bacterium]